MKLFWIAFLTIVVLSIAFVMLAIWGPSQRLTVSKKTTVIESPLRPDGLPDYSQHILNMMAADVGPDENAAVLYWQAMWPANLDTKEHQVAICNALGMPIPSKAGIDDIYDDAKRELQEWVRQECFEELPDINIGLDPIETLAYDLCQRAVEAPWTEKQFPPLANWLRGNEREIDLLVAGSARLKYFNPPPNMVDGSNDRMVEMLLPGVNMLRDASRALGTRAMWHLGEGRVDEAWNDLKASHQLARHVARGWTLVGYLVASAIERATCQRTNTLLHHGNVTAEQARRVQRELHELPPLESPLTKIDDGERFIYLERIASCSIGEIRMDDFRPIFGNHNTPSDLTARRTLDTTRIDWNEVARQGNQWFDRIIRAGKLARRQRNQALEQIENDLNQSARVVRARDLMRVKSRTQLMADTSADYFARGHTRTFEVVDRNETVTNMTRIVAALAVYRADRGHYPDSLDELKPSAIANVPLDLYSEQPYQYRRTDQGYCLYSVGENEVDDGGTNGDIFQMKRVTESDTDGPGTYDPDADIVVLMPMPPFHVKASP
ncbi:hypothetical protein ACFL2H_01225 [Planctomycetota bacterium]